MVLTGGRRATSYVEINLFEPHRPYDHGGVRPDESRGVHVPPYMPDDDGSRREMSALQGAIMEADRAIGRIVGALDDGGLLDDALIVFTVDHGIAMPRAKCTLYDPGIEIALIMRWPGGGIGPAISAELVSNVDVAPTLLEITHIHAPEVLQGRSFLALLENRDYEPRAAVYAEKTWHSYYDPMRAIRTQRYKLIATSSRLLQWRSRQTSGGGPCSASPPNAIQGTALPRSSFMTSSLTPSKP